MEHAVRIVGAILQVLRADAPYGREGDGIDCGRPLALRVPTRLVQEVMSKHAIQSAAVGESRVELNGAGHDRTFAAGGRLSSVGGPRALRDGQHAVQFCHLSGGRIFGDEVLQMITTLFNFGSGGCQPVPGIRALTPLECLSNLK
jgi:hypothetical protein